MKNNIKEERKKLNITQQKLADNLNISRKNLNDSESGKVNPRIDVAYKIAVELDNTLESIFIDEEYMKLGNIHISAKEQDRYINNFANAYINLK